MTTDDSEPKENDLPHDCWNLSGSEETKDEFDKFFSYWSRSEDVAMHFNQLILNLRLKALGGILVGGVLLTAALKHDRTFQSVDWWALAAFFGASLVIWISVWIIDRSYYCHLLRGAVNEIERLEAMSKGRILLSLSIEHAVARNKDRIWWENKEEPTEMTKALINIRKENNGSATKMVTCKFYLLMTVVLAFLLVVCIGKATCWEWGAEIEVTMAVALFLASLALL